MGFVLCTWLRGSWSLAVGLAGVAPSRVNVQMQAVMPGKAEGVQKGGTSFAWKGTLQIPQDLLSFICSVTAVLP